MIPWIVLWNWCLVAMANKISSSSSLHLHTKFHFNRVISGWDRAIKPFSKWRPSAILNFRNLRFWSRGLCLSVILLQHEISRYSDNISLRYSQNDFQYGVVRNIGFAVTLSYCIRVLYITFLTLCWIFFSIGLLPSDILGLSCFIILAGNCPFEAKFV